ERGAGFSKLPDHAEIVGGVINAADQRGGEQVARETILEQLQNCLAHSDNRLRPGRHVIGQRRIHTRRLLRAIEQSSARAAVTVGSSPHISTLLQWPPGKRSPLPASGSRHWRSPGAA